MGHVTLMAGSQHELDHAIAVTRRQGKVVPADTRTN